MLSLSVYCPKCSTHLPDWDPDITKITCGQCGLIFQSKDGIFNFLLEDEINTHGTAFDRLSSHAQVSNDPVEKRDYRKIFNRILKQNNPIPKNQHILLDAGCGYGGLSIAAAPFFDHVIAVDAGDNELEYLSKIVREKGITNIHIFKASLCNLPFAHGQFAGIACVQVLEHVRDQRRLIQNLFQVLAEDGILYLSTPNRYALKTEPHTRLWGVGYLPPKMALNYARVFNRQEIYTGLSLVSSDELRNLLMPYFHRNFSFIRSGIHTTFFGRLAKWAWDKPMLHWLAKALISDTEVIGWKTRSR